MRSDRGLVKRHVRRCAVCRATARELGLRPRAGVPRRRVSPRLLPLPFVPGAFGAKAAAVVAAVALAGGGVGARRLERPARTGEPTPPATDPPTAVQHAGLAAPRARPAAGPARPASAPVPRGRGGRGRDAIA